MKPCRHLASISLGKLTDRLAAAPPLNQKLCFTCPKNNSNPSESTFTCLTCLETFCRPVHLNQHSRDKNHPISIKSLHNDSDSIEKEFYCALCADYPKIREPGKKERITLEKIKRLILENQKNDPITTKDDKDDIVVNSELHTDSTPDQIPKGIVNLGNTCFMNSALQLLAATLNRHGPPKITSNSPIWNSLLHHLDEIYSNTSNKKKKSSNSTGSHVIPSEFLGLLCGKQKKFAAMQQQDAHDFLRLLFNSVSEAPQVELFGGKFVSRVICDRCRKVSDTIEPFLDISLALPDDKSDDQLSKSLSNLNISQEDSEECTDKHESCIINLPDLLRNWNKKILLHDENGYYCEACSPQDTQILQNASLQFFLTENMPPFLIFHLQRFKTKISLTKGRKSKGSGGYSVEIEKDDRSVGFPLNLSIPSDCSLNSDDKASQQNYRLYGYVIHEGSSTSSGHYTAVVSSKSSDRWYYISDTRVKEISKSRALDPDSYCPYLLFYQLVN